MFIDYISATFNDPFNQIYRSYVNNGAQAFGDIVPTPLMHALGSWRVQGDIVSRRPYKYGASFRSGFAVFFGGHDTFMVEITGRGCAAINPYTVLEKWLSRDGRYSYPLNKITRIDIAHDKETDEMPFEAVSRWRISDRIKTRGVQNSQTGQTFYVGSRNSDRFARVYRYFEPHPRANMLRTEFQFNKGVATDIATQLVFDNIPVKAIFSAAMNQTFNNPPIALENATARVNGVSERSNSNTVVWMYKQVLPAMKRLHQAGEIDIEEFVRKVKEDDIPF